MIQVTDKVWVGNSGDERDNSQGLYVLNVAADLHCTRPKYTKVGLVDGPGNDLATYCAAVMALVGLVRDGRDVLVCCHTGSRALPVCLMYLATESESEREWDEQLAELRERVMEKSGQDILELADHFHDAHKKAYEDIDWIHLADITGRWTT